MEQQVPIPPANGGLPPGVTAVGPATPPTTPAPIIPITQEVAPPPPPPATPQQLSNGGSVSATKNFFSNTNWVLVTMGILAVAGVCGVIWYVRKRAYIFNDKQNETDLRIMSLQSQVSEINKQNDAPGVAA